MAVWSRAYIIKASLLVAILLLVLNVYYNILPTSRFHEIPTVSSLLHSRFNRTSNKSVNTNIINNGSKNHSIASLANVTHPSALLLGNVNATTLYEVAAETTVVTQVDIEEQRKNTTNEAHNNEVGISEKKDATARKCPAIPPNLEGPITINPDPRATLDQRFVDKLDPGGWYRPTECATRERVAIVVPYRDRADHLVVFVRHMHPLLQKQQIEYGIFVVEQADDNYPFNRAALMNVGFVEALKLASWDCFIFHDVDLLPLDDRNLYSCPDQPRHMSVAVDKFGYKLPYKSIFGGVSAMTTVQLKKVNGFSNSFWGWGGEDDDMYNRLRNSGYFIARYPVNVARYTMLEHTKARANPKRYEILYRGSENRNQDGLNSMHYTVLQLEKKTLYTWILAKILPETPS